MTLMHANSLRLLVTGASGFLGRALVRQLAKIKGAQIHALDIRQPPKSIAELPGVEFFPVDISSINSLYSLLHGDLGTPTYDYAVHLAAYWNFKPGTKRLYQRVNVEGTRHVINYLEKTGAKRMIFASSMEALSAYPYTITESSAPNVDSQHPYGWSKAMSEWELNQRYAYQPRHTKLTILRIGGVFDAWCELPPLAAVMRRWSLPWPIGGVIPGRGETGFGYLHRDDFTDLALNVIEHHETLPQCHNILACPNDVTTLNDLHPLIRHAYGLKSQPIHVPTQLVRFLFNIEKTARSTLAPFGMRDCIEEDWMFDHVDKPYNTLRKTKPTLFNWEPNPNRHILKQIEEMTTFAKNNPKEWQEKQDLRMRPSVR